MTIARELLVLVVALTTPSCLGSASVTLHLAPTRLICTDGVPAKLFLDPRCPSGVCGYTCAPDRWRAFPLENP